MHPFCGPKVPFHRRCPTSLHLSWLEEKLYRQKRVLLLAPVYPGVLRTDSLHFRSVAVNQSAPVKQQVAGRPELRWIMGNLEVGRSPVLDEGVTCICIHLPSREHPAFNLLKGISVPSMILFPQYFSGRPKLVS